MTVEGLTGDATPPGPAGSSEILSFSIDGLSLLFGLLITGIGVAVILYAEHYLHGHPEIDRFHALALAFMASMLGVVLSNNVVTLFIFWELLAVSSVVFIWARGTERAVDAGMRYLIFQILSGLFLLAMPMIFSSRSDSPIRGP